MKTKISHTPRAVRERAALYTAGALPDAERASFEVHLRGGCADCAAEVAAYGDALPALAATVASTPPAGLRQRVVARVAAERALRESPVLALEGQRFVRSEGLAWAAGTQPGVEVKTLLVDRVRQRITRLVRMQGGAAIRPHRHVDIEESYILEGELLVDGVLMRVGDYCRAESGTVHHEVRSVGGCVLLTNSALGDELLPESGHG